MRRYSLSYFIGQGFKGLYRNGTMSIASVLVLMSCLVVLGSFALISYNVDYNLENLGHVNQIVAFISDDMTNEDIENMKVKVETLDNVEAVKVTTKEEALEEERKRYANNLSLLAVLEGDDNPYPAMFTITYKENDKVANLSYQLANIEGLYKVSSHIEVSEGLQGIKSAVGLIFSIFFVILFIVSIFVIMITIKLAIFSRKSEISVMRYVGATNAFVLTPFVIEGMLMGFIASVLAYFLQMYAYISIEKSISTNFERLITMVPFESFRNYLAIAFLAIGIVTGIFGSVASLRKNLKV